MRRRALIMALAVGVAPAPLTAQYAWSPSDTLRYAEVTKGRVEMAVPTGTAAVHSLHDAVIAVTLAENGRAHAWYDALVVESSGPLGAAKPSTASLLRQPYEFQFARTGHIAEVKAPTMPPEVAAMTDLTRQFDDFFITVPEGDLTLGRSWTDTVANTTSARESDQTSSRHIRSYIVEGDTSVAGVSAVVIRVTQTVDLESSSEMPEQNMRVAVKLAGTDEGWALFAPSLGRMLERTRTGSLTGEMRLEPAGMDAIVIPQSYTYDSSIQLRR